MFVLLTTSWLHTFARTLHVLPASVGGTTRSELRGTLSCILRQWAIPRHHTGYRDVYSYYSVRFAAVAFPADIDERKDLLR